MNKGRASQKKHGRTREREKKTDLDTAQARSTIGPVTSGKERSAQGQGLGGSRGRDRSNVCRPKDRGSDKHGGLGNILWVRARRFQLNGIFSHKGIHGR